MALRRFTLVLFLKHKRETARRSQLAARRHLVVAQLAALAAQQLRHLLAALAHGVAQGGAAPAVGGVDVGAAPEQQVADE